MHHELLALALAFSLLGALIATLVILVLSYLGAAGGPPRKTLYVLLLAELALLGMGTLTQKTTFSGDRAVEDIGATAVIEVHERMFFVMAKIDRMSDEGLTSLVADRPEFAAEVDRAVNAIDPENTRTSDPEMARRALRRYVSFSGRNDKELREWETLLAKHSRKRGR
jgi:hypothetical protein